MHWDKELTGTVVKAFYWCIEVGIVFLIALFLINRYGGVRSAERDVPQRQSVIHRRGHYRSFRRIITRAMWHINRNT